MVALQIHQRRYLGSKTKLLPYIKEILNNEGVAFHTFLDLFAGTGVVGHSFNEQAALYLNDILYSNYLSYHAFMGKDQLNHSLLDEYITTFNSLISDEVNDNYFSLNFSNTYFSHENCKIIGHVRDVIEQDYQNKIINFRERAYLVTSLLYAMDRIANTVGHYDAYRKTDDLDRLLVFRTLEVSDKFNTNNKIFNMDANQLVKEVSTDVIYIDPPYNSRQYSDAYHLLENVAQWKKPEVKGVAKKMDRSEIKSNYNLKTAANAFSDLIDNINAKFILVSYNDMGTNGCERSQARITDHEIISALERKGNVTIYEKEFQQFTTGKSNKEDLMERVFFCRIEEEKKATTKNKSLKVRKGKIKPQPFVKSPLNFTGGKHKLLPKLMPFFPNDIHTFYDVFCGGVNVGINAKANSIICIDNNLPLIELLQYIQDLNFEELHQRIVKKIEEFDLSQSYIHGYNHYGCESSKGLGRYNKDKFLNLREIYNKVNNKEEKSLLLLILIIYGFNNQIRFNRRGEYNLPVGKRDYNGNTRKNLAKFNESSNAKNIRFMHADFSVLSSIEFSADDFVYLDPPYFLGTASYNENGGWSEFDEKNLYEVLDNLDEKGVRFALSNVSEHKGETHELLLNWVNAKGYRVIHLDYNYNNSNYQSKAKDSETNEILVVNYNTPLL